MHVTQIQYGCLGELSLDGDRCRQQLSTDTISHLQWVQWSQLDNVTPDNDINITKYDEKVMVQ